MRKFLLTALLVSGLASAVGTPVGTQISNIGTLELSDTVGGTTTTTLSSTPVVINVQQVYNVSITPDGTTAAPGQTVGLAPGQTGFLTYTVTNTGNGTDAINLAAITANATAQGANILGIYLDNKATGTVGSYDAGDTLVTSLTNVAADASNTVFVRYSIPSGTTGGSAAGSAHQLNLTGTSVGDGTKTDTNNVGQFTVGSVIDMTLTSTQSKTVAAGTTVTFTDVLTNTGNVTLLATDVTAAVVATATNKLGTTITNTFTTSYTVTGGQGGTATGTDLETVLNTAIGTGLLSGSALTITVTNTPATGTTPATGAADGDVLILSLETYSPTTGVTNNALQGDAQGRITNTTTVQRGVGTVTKKLALCTTTTTCPDFSAAGTTTINAKPGDYVVYYLEALNTGTGSLYNIRLSDALPANFVPVRIGASTTAAAATALRFSTNGTTWNNDVTTLGTLTGGTSRLYVAVENGGTATTIDSSDTFNAGNSLRLRIVGYVRKDAVTGGTVTREDIGINN
ncbi:hypothetical protein [Deinococcus aquatilis]|uniref:hypothetical protein n=1 Tax=Deinococcus aquatilis TaxID=519440 RepID=UPI000372B662|nr:hypothetical protein [Deinococcus aquatilis]